jgi:YHS domain-containing protein
MNKLFTLGVIVVFMLAVTTPLATAACSVGHKSAGGGEEAAVQEATTEATLENVEVINKICPVMGGEVGKDTKYTVEHEGKTIGLCCAGCVEKFNEDPEGYIKKLEEETEVEE